jgi:hypothetical protein
MIGGKAGARRRGYRATASGAIAALLLGAVLAARPAAAAGADPPAEADREAQLLATAADADAALERLQVDLEASVEAARQGAALVVSGQDSPEPPLNEAATALEHAGQHATAAVAAANVARGTLACVRPAIPAIPADGVVADRLTSIATQLRESASAAATFVDHRLATEATLAALSDALAALDGDDPNRALAALDEADAALREVVAWEQRPPTLGYWLQTTAELLAAARGIADAAIARDPAAVAAAAAAYRAAADKAVDADRSRELAMAEAGSAITAAPLRRLAGALAEVTELRATIAAVAGAS